MDPPMADWTAEKICHWLTAAITRVYKVEMEGVDLYSTDEENGGPRAEESGNWERDTNKNRSRKEEMRLEKFESEVLLPNERILHLP